MKADILDDLIFYKLDVLPHYPSQSLSIIVPQCFTHLPVLDNCRG